MAIAAAGAATGWLWWRSSQLPAWWSPPDEADPRAVELGERVEHALVTHAHQIRPSGEPWAIRLREEQANAWLATRLPRWVAHRGHAGDEGLPRLVQVRFEPGRVRIGALLPEAIGRGVLDIALLPVMEGGRLKLTVDRVALGRVAVSGDPLAALVSELKRSRVLDDLVSSDSAEDAERLARAIIDAEPFDPVFELQDGRVVRLLDLMAGNGELVLQWRTDPQPQEPAPKSTVAGPDTFAPVDEKGPDRSSFRQGEP